MKYKVGDKVRRISMLDSNLNVIKIGMKGEVTRIVSFTTKYPYNVRWENGNIHGMNESEIALVKPKPKIPKKKLEAKKKAIIKEIKNNPSFLRQFTDVEKEVNEWEEEAIINWK